MRRGEIVAAFERDGLTTASSAVNRSWALTERFARLYEHRGLIVDAAAEPLWKCCPNAADCWSAAWDARPTGGREDGGIPLPWVGSQYHESRLVVLGINQIETSGLARSFEVVLEDIRARGPSGAAKPPFQGQPLMPPRSTSWRRRRH